MKKIISFIVLILWMIVIFSFSSADANKSTGTSDKVITTMIEIKDKITNNETPNNEKEIIVKNSSFYIRKIAHITEYLILGFLMFNLLKQYKQVFLYRHINPDYDAFGSTVGMYYFLKENFPEINVVLKGNFENVLWEKFNATIDEEKELPILGIVIDTANRERIDGDISVCEKIIKIDHHIVVDSYGDINIEDATASSASQIVSLLLEEVKDSYSLNEQGARALYMGIIGDTNRFMYRSTDARTFKAASYLLESGINIEEIYQTMYLREEKDLKVTQFILNNYKVNDKVAYYILKDEDLKELGISREEGSSYVNTLANVKEFEVWCAITENTKDNVYRVSIRSRNAIINEVAAKFGGGGHALASGATLSSLDQLEDLLSSLHDAISMI